MGAGTGRRQANARSDGGVRPNVIHVNHTMTLTPLQGLGNRLFRKRWQRFAEKQLPKGYNVQSPAYMEKWLDFLLKWQHYQEDPNHK